MSRNNLFSPVACSEITSIRYYINGDIETAVKYPIGIFNSSLFKGFSPIPGGVCDARLGTIDYQYLCETCINKKSKCPGHAGHVKMKVPLIQPLFYEFLIKILKIFCHNCGRYLQGRTKTCYCGVSNPSVKKGKTPFEVIINGKEAYPFDIEPILKLIPVSEIEKAGFNFSFDRLIIRMVNIPTIGIRPDIRTTNNTRSNNDDVTTFLFYLLKVNETLPATSDFRELIKRDPKILRDYENISLLYSELIRGGTMTTKNRSKILSGINIYSYGPNKTTESIAKRLKYKKGRIRHNILGKRVRTIARSNISCDTRVSVDEVIIPLEIAKVISISEIVQEYNYDILLGMLHNGYLGIYPMITIIKKKNSNKMYNVSGMTDLKLEFGDVIYRNVITGDEVLFNRAPSLYYASIQKFSVIVASNDDKTIKMNNMICLPFGADFDGDEMNLIFAPSYVAKAEMRILSAVGNWTISCKNTKLHVERSDDSIYGGVEISRKDLKLNKSQVMDYISSLKYIPDIKFDEFNSEWSGLDLISKILPNTLNFNKKSKIAGENGIYAKYMGYDSRETDINIINGKVLSGTLDIAIADMFKSVIMELGVTKFLELIHSFQQVVIKHLFYNGYTLGIKDVIKNENATKEIKGIISKLLYNSNEINEKYIKGQLVTPIGVNKTDYYEYLQTSTLSHDFLEPFLKNLDRNNYLFKLISSGSKGSFSNLRYIAGCIGQIMVKGKRIQQMFSHGRTLSYFPRYDVSAQSRGFLTNCYIDGLTPSELGFNAMSERINLIKKVLLVAVSGDQARINMRNLESLVLNNNRFMIRETNIVQMLGYEDGFDIRSLETFDFKDIQKNDIDFLAEFGINNEELTYYNNKILKYKKKLASILINIENVSVNTYINYKLHVAVNTARYLKDQLIFQKNMLGTDYSASDEEIIKMMKTNYEFCKLLKYVYFNCNFELLKKPIPSYNNKVLLLIKFSILLTLKKENLKKLTHQSLLQILDKIKLKLISSLIEYGTPCGIITAQCVSEVVTQLQLKSIHVSDNSKAVKKDGIDRIKEILSIKPIEKCEDPSMLIALKDNTTEIRANEIINTIKTIEFKNIVTKWQVLIEPTPFNTNKTKFTADQEFINNFVRNNQIQSSQVTEWVFRFTLDKYKLIYYKLKIEDIVATFNSLDYVVVHNRFQDKNIILRIYIKKDLASNKIEYKNLLKFTEESILSVILKGIKGIKNASLIKNLKRNEILEDGSIQTKQKIFIQTIGINFIGIYKLQMSCPEIDFNNIHCDNIHQCYLNFGYLGTKKKMLDELSSVYGDHINQKHFSLIADGILNKGKPIPMNRNGTNKTSKEPLVKIANSAPIKQIKASALESKMRPAHQVSSRVMLGNPGGVGANYNSLIV